MVRSIVVVASILIAAPALADPPVSARHAMTDRDRIVHAALIVAMGTAYLGIQIGLASDLASTNCRWCQPPSYDVTIRNALVWHHAGTADALSTGTGYVAAPIAVTGLLLAASWTERDGRLWFDDISAILEPAIAVSLLQHAAKFTVAQQRPYVYFAPPGTRVPDKDDNTSFWSGHASLTFALAVAGGEVADDRGYALAPAIWATGLVLAGTTSYLRIAADKHWATDVAVGALMGSAVGYAWPRLLRPDLRIGGHPVVVSPTAGGLSLSGAF